MKGIKSFRRTFLLIAALYLACGISLLVWPAQSGLVICYVFGGISLLYGAVQIIRYCCNAAVSIFRYELVTGILCCAFGLFVILRADMVLAVLPFVFGCAIVFDSVMTLQNAIDLRRLGFSRWWLILLLAGVTGAFGVLLFFEPFAALAMVRFIGAVLVLDGCADLVSVLCLTYWVKKAKRGLEAIYDEARYEAAAIEAVARTPDESEPCGRAEQKRGRAALRGGLFLCKKRRRQAGTPLCTNAVRCKIKESTERERAV